MRCAIPSIILPLFANNQVPATQKNCIRCQPPTVVHDEVPGTIHWNIVFKIKNQTCSYVILPTESRVLLPPPPFHWVQPNGNGRRVNTASLAVKSLVILYSLGTLCVGKVSDVRTDAHYSCLGILMAVPCTFLKLQSDCHGNMKHY